MSGLSRTFGHLGVAAAVLAFCACREPNYGPTTRSLGRTEVVFVPALHARHLESDEYPLARVSSLLELVQPSVVVVQATPALVAAVVADPSLLDTEHPWFDALPESREAMRYALEHGLPLSGISAHNADARARFAQYRVSYPDGPEDDVYRRARDYLRRRSAREGRTKPEWLSSPLYRRMSAWSDRARDRALGDDPARPDWNGHRRLFRETLREHPGQRLAVVFDARRLWVLDEELKETPGVRLDLRAFLP